MTSRPLQNCTLVVTRPASQAGPLIEILQAAGATAVHFPVIKITPIEEQDALTIQAKHLGSYDIAIFISRNAATYGSELLPQASWPAGTQIAAIGNGTARQLQSLGFNTDIVSGTTANTEGLLSVPQMNTVAGKRILIIRGLGGREKLADSLRQRGAEVDYFECYQRIQPDSDPTILTRLWHNDSLHGIILTSAEGLKNLYRMVDRNDLARLNTTPLYVISSTMVELCSELGYKLTPILVPSAYDADVLESLTANCNQAANKSAGKPNQDEQI